MTAKRFLLTAALLLTCCHFADAQTPPNRHGPWIDAGLGVGPLHVSSDTLRGRTQTGNDVFLDVGWTLTSWFRAGVGVDQWTSKWGAGKQNWVTSADLGVYVYPFRRRAFYFQASANSADYLAVHVPPSGERADTIYFSGTAWGMTGGVGWDLPVHQKFALRPALLYSYGPPRSLHTPDGALVATGWRHRLLLLDVGVILHPEGSR